MKQNPYRDIWDFLVEEQPPLKETPLNDKNN